MKAYQRAERLVGRHLESAGHLILAYNYTVHNIGEVDIISYCRGRLYATEVKARQVDTISESERTFNRSKQKRVLRTFRTYLASQGQSDRDLGLLAARVHWNTRNEVRSIQIDPWPLYT